MSLFEKQYSILLGNYGSGKTELSIALARALRRRVAGRVALVDLDIVNPYFRSGERAELLKSEGIEVFMPSFALSTVDIPALPAEINGVFQQGFQRVVIDVGGDDTGATALGRYAPELTRVRAETQVLYVVNPFRPLSGTEEEIGELYRLIAQKARITPDLMVNNANLQEQTTAADLIQAQALLARVSQRLNLPVGAVTGMPALERELPPALQALYFPLEPVMKPDWLRDEP